MPGVAEVSGWAFELPQLIPGSNTESSCLRCCQRAGEQPKYSLGFCLLPMTRVSGPNPSHIGLFATALPQGALESEVPPNPTNLVEAEP